jgi:hypothetical protein
MISRVSAPSIYHGYGFIKYILRLREEAVTTRTEPRFPPYAAFLEFARVP